ncbi:nucleotidyltransferase family protein [Sphingomonas sp.]|uniref:nucleotidyltransferase family protein n=1 Tax=Sphingomonas sp. TaxID=28214 RepID=UPI0035BC1165
MIAVERTVLLLLAAGRSTRYGDVGSKLDEDFLGSPLGLHVAVTLEAVPFLERIAVTGSCRIDYAEHGFRVLRNDAPEAGIASSIRLGVKAAQEQDADAVMLALADMPRVTATHIHRLFEAARGFDSVVASSNGVETSPPALFGRDRFEFLLALKGDEGARDLVRAGRHVVTAPAELIDVDTAEDLAELRALVHAPDRALTRAPAPSASLKEPTHDGARRSD